MTVKLLEISIQRPQLHSSFARGSVDKEFSVCETEDKVGNLSSDSRSSLFSSNCPVGTFS